MKNIYNHIRISQLIAKEVNDGLDSKEQQELTEWIMEDEDNYKLYDKIRSQENFIGWDQQFRSVDVEKGWQKFDKAIMRNRRVVMMRTLVQYAAAVLIPLFIAGIGYFLYTDINKQESIAHLPHFVNQKPKARLILADGQKVNLESVEASAMKEKDGTKIEKGEGNLKYEAAEKQNKTKTLYNTVVIPRGGEYQLQLADGTKVYLNSVSSLKFPVQFNGKTREVELEGEAYFEVTKDAKHPFVVNISGTRIEVLGTSFNVKAYNEEDEVVTTLVEGSVKVKSKGVSGGSMLLKPGQQAIVEQSSGVMDMREVDVGLFTSWKEGVFLFKNQPLEDVMSALARWYDVEVFYPNEKVKSLRFGGHFDRAGDLDMVLNMFNMTRKVNIQRKGKGVVVNAK